MHLKSFQRPSRLLAMMVPVLALMGCFGDGDGKPRIAGTPPPPPPEPEGEVLIFADEFNDGTMPSAANWTIETGYGPNNDGNGNNEWQLYTDSSDNIRVEGGNLVISALCPTPPCGVRDGTITSGKITSLDKFEFKYGRVEARIKPPVGKAAWPAFWALGANHPDVGWPRSGEIDFMEMHNAFSNERTTHFTIHWCDESIPGANNCAVFPNGWVFDTRNRSFDNSLGDDFHIFEADWSEDRIIGKIDGITYFDRTIDPATMEEFRRDFFLILNVAMGGTLGSDNQPPDGTETYPQTMLVDYVRVYQTPGDDEPDGGDDAFSIDFEDDGGPYLFNDFEGGVGFVTDNPDMDGNSSAKVAQMFKFAGADFAGTLLKAPDIFDVPLGSSFTVKVWSQRPVNMLFKLEGGPAAELNLAHGGTGWETLTADFPGISGSFTGITFIFDLGVVGDAEGDPDNWTFYVDDIVLVPGDGGGEDPGGSTIDFEPAGGPYTFNDFEGGVGFVSANPDMSGINTSANVATILKFAGADFAGTTLKPNSPLEVMADSSFTIKVWSQREVDMLFKLEGTPSAETTVTHTGAGWEELTIDFPGVSGTFSGITFIFDLGVVGDATNDPDNWTFYIDDITLVPPDGGGDPGGGDPGVVSDFEAGGGPYVFNDFEGGVGSVVSNPDMSGINTSAMVGQMQKFAGADFAGSTLKLPAPVDVTAGSSFTMKVWSQRSVDVLFKLEGTPSFETTVTHGGTGWELLTFELPGASGSFGAITLIFDLGVVGDAMGNPADWTFYFDDITLVPPDGGGDPDPGGGSTVVVSDFEGDPLSYDFGMDGGFGGGAASVVNNPEPGGINTSAQVGQMLKYAGEIFGGSTLALATPLTVPTGSSFTIKVWSPRVVDVLFKLEGPAVAELELTHGGTGWEEMTFDFPAFEGTVEGITLIFDLGEIGAAGTDPTNWTFYFDDITLLAAGGGGGGTTQLADFEADPLSYDFGMDGGFGGGASSVIANPQSGGINTSAQVGQMLKYAGEIFGGSTLALSPAVDVAAGSSFTMKVWSPRAVDVLFKLEGATVAELELTHGGTGWEEMNFAFPAFSGSIDGITQIYDLGDIGAAGTDPANWTFYFDDITLISSGR